MRKLADNEIISLTALLKMEKDGLAVSKVMQTLITDDELKKQAKSSVLTAESRIKGVQQFINENHVTGNREV